MKHNKSLDIDEFSSEFFKVFWDKIDIFVLLSLNESYKTGQLSVSFRQCVILCLQKGDKTIYFLKNWRLISLLSMIYKIVPSALSIRLKSVLENIISPTHSRFVAYHFTGETTHIIYNIIHYTKILGGKTEIFVLLSLNINYKTGQLSVSFRQCLISCLPKGDKPIYFLKNWKLISLLSVINKLVSSALSVRLKSVLENIISPTQSGFVANYFIGENIQIIYDIIHYTKVFGIKLSFCIAIFK